MSNLTRSALFVVLASGGAAYGPSSVAQPVDTKSELPPPTVVDGRFSRYLESSNGDIDGIVLEGGTVARFAPFNRTLRPAPFRTGDSVRVTGDVVSGLAGPYLVHALVTGINVPTARGVVVPESSRATAGSGARMRRAGKAAKEALKDRTQAPRAPGKPSGPSTERSKRLDDVLLVASPNARARKKGRLETIGSKASEVTAGKRKNDNSSPWGRAQETAGP